MPDTQADPTARPPTSVAARRLSPQPRCRRHGSVAGRPPSPEKRHRAIRCEPSPVPSQRVRQEPTDSGGRHQQRACENRARRAAPRPPGPAHRPPRTPPRQGGRPPAPRPRPASNHETPGQRKRPPSTSVPPVTARENRRIPPSAVLAVPPRPKEQAVPSNPRRRATGRDSPDRKVSRRPLTTLTRAKTQASREHPARTPQPTGHGVATRAPRHPAKARRRAGRPKLWASAEPRPQKRRLARRANTARPARRRGHVSPLCPSPSRRRKYTARPSR